jgi:hypothetical protein
MTWNSFGNSDKANVLHYLLPLPSTVCLDACSTRHIPLVENQKVED